jgi:hypothetical protein
MKYTTIYTTKEVREKAIEVTRNTRKTLDVVCRELILKGIPLVTFEDLIDVSREAQVRASFMELAEHTKMKESIPFHGYRTKGKYNEFLGLALEKALPTYGIVDLESIRLSCVSDSDVNLLKLLYPTCDVKGMTVTIKVASDEALARLSDIVSTMPGITFRANPLSGEFQTLKVNGYMHTMQRGDYKFYVEIKNGEIHITARGTSREELITLTRDVMNFIKI